MGLDDKQNFAAGNAALRVAIQRAAPTTPGVSPVATGVAFSLGAAAWGAAFLIPFKMAGEQAPRMTVIFAMLLVAAVCNTIATLIQARGRLRIDRRTTLVALVLAACTVLGNLGVVTSLATLEPAVSSVVLQVQVIMVALLELFFLRERLARSLLLGCVLALIGFVVMQAPWDGGHADLVGIGWAMLGTTMFAIMLVVLRHSIAQLDSLAVNALRLWLAIGLLAVLPGTLSTAVEMSASIWLLAAAAGLAGPTLSRLMLMAALRHISATQTKLTTLVSPLFALFFGWLAFSSLPTGTELIGGAVILAGVALPLTMQFRRRPALEQ